MVACLSPHMHLLNVKLSTPQEASTNAISDNERSKYSAEEMAAAFPKAPSVG